MFVFDTKQPAENPRKVGHRLDYVVTVISSGTSIPGDVGSKCHPIRVRCLSICFSADGERHSIVHSIM